MATKMTIRLKSGFTREHALDEDAKDMSPAECAAEFHERLTFDNLTQLHLTDAIYRASEIEAIIIE
jgi:hypothetical protein